jgi:hypothetical protein
VQLAKSPKQIDPLHGAYSKCVDIAVQGGHLTAKAGQDILKSDNIDRAIADLVEGLSRKKREAAVDSVRIASAWKDITSHSKGAYEGLMAMMTKDIHGTAGYKNVEYLGKFYEGKYHAKFADAMSRFRTRSLGWSQDDAALKDLVRGVFGKTDVEADIKGFSDDWLEIQELMRKEFNAKGGSISKNEKHVLPQNHDAQSILKAGSDKWKSLMRSTVDRELMLNDLGKPMDNAEFERALDFGFESITTHGLNKTDDFSSIRMGTKLSRKGSAKRFFHFKDAESWLAYQDEFGRGDIFTTLTDHINNMSNDIAVMERFGTNPKLNFERLKSQVEKTKPMTGLQKTSSTALFNVATGNVNGGELTTAADFLKTVVNGLVSAMLGKAMLSSISDIGMNAITSNYNGIGALKVWKRQASLMNPANEADRIASVKIGLIAETWTGRSQAASRYADVYGTGLSTKVAGTVMRASLLETFTQSGRKAFGMEYSSMLADNFKKTMDNLDPNTQRAFDTYGITAKDWDLFRKSKTLDFKGGQFADMTSDGGVKFHQMVMSETDFAVPTPDARVRAITTGGLGRATGEGMAWRAAMMFKSFPVTIMTTHFYRGLNQATLGGKMAYLGAVTATASVMGGVALQAKDIAAGREPRPMDNFGFVRDAIVQGGGLSLFGDVLLQDHSKFGGKIGQGIGGPQLAFAGDVYDLTLGNAYQAVVGDETNVLGESAKFLNRYTPDIWQTQLISNAIFDQIQMLGDPKAEKNFNRLRKKRKSELDQDYWWRRGEALPEFLND